MRSSFVFAVLVLAGRTARADGALEELSAGTVPQTATSAQSTWVTDKLAGMWEPSDEWQVRLDLSGTHAIANDKAGDVLLATLGVEYDPGHWMFRIAGGGSPTSTTSSSMALTLPGPMGVINADGQLSSQASSLTAAASAGYDTAGDGAVETTVMVTANATRFDALQQLDAVTGNGGMTYTLDQLRDFCSKRTCSKDLNSTLAAQATTLNQVALGASISEQLFGDTDVGVDGAYYLYDNDPTTIGYYSSLAAARTTSSTGIGIAPMQYMVSPSLIHRFGPLMVMTSASYGKYVGTDGYDTSATVRVQYKLNLGGDRRLKLWTKATGSRDHDAANALSKSGSLALGVQFAW
jgi:hypothetical protein